MRVTSSPVLFAGAKPAPTKDVIKSLRSGLKGKDLGKLDIKAGSLPNTIYVKANSLDKLKDAFKQAFKGKFRNLKDNGSSVTCKLQGNEVNLEQIYRGGGSFCGKPGSGFTPGWIRREQW